MFLAVVAEPPHGFARWINDQRQPASQPGDGASQRGVQLFAAKGCIACHAVRFGERPVGGTVGPDLTHVGSRLTLGAGRLDNRPGALAGWIDNPQALKPTSGGRCARCPAWPACTTCTSGRSPPASWP
jgi:cytochrome c oxidase subunit 2